MKKRLLAAFLSLIMVVSLLPLAVTADGTDTNVKNGYYENGVWKEGTLTQVLPKGVDSVSKTAVKKSRQSIRGDS